MLIGFTLPLCSLTAQIDSLSESKARETGFYPVGDTLYNDSTLVDSLTTDSIATDFKISENALEQEISFASRDSFRFNNASRSVELYDQAKVNTSAIQLKAGFISLDMENNIAYAKGAPDSLGRMGQYPDMNMEDENFKAKEVKYNLRRERGIILNSYRKQDDLFIRSEKTKYKREDGNRVLYNAEGIITTCEYPHPHYGIRSHKQKVILDKIAVIGPSNIELGGVPTPVWIPFGFFPIKSGKQTGLLFPRDYEYSPSLGFGLRNVGYYFPINDYVDLTATTDIYLRGSYRINLNSRYKKRYKYNGNVSLSYASIKQEIINEKKGKIHIKRKPSFGILINHSQDPNAHPTRKISGRVRIQTNNYKEDNYNDAESVLQNSLNSNLSYTQTFYDDFLTLSAGLKHSQNTETHDISFTFPSVNLNMRRFFPFRNEDKIGKEKWYEGISLKYDSKLEAHLDTKDTLLFTQQALDTIRTGMLHEFSSDHTFNLFKYIHVRPSVNFSSEWYPYTIRKELTEDYKIRRDTTFDDEDKIIGIDTDTTEYGIVRKYEEPGFSVQNQFDAQIALNTSIYGTVKFRKGWIRGLRHLVKPYFNLNYSPNYDKWGYYNEYVDDLRPEEADIVRYSIFEDGIYSGGVREPRLGMSYGLNNVFESKIYSRKDSAVKNITLLPTLSIKSGYNFIADSFKMDDIRFSGNFTLIKNFSRVTFSGGFSVYEKDAEGELIDRYLWENNNGVARFEGLEVTVNTQFSVKQFRDFLMGESTGKEKSVPSNYRNLSSIFDNINVRHTMRLTYDKLADRDTFLISSHEINIRGSIPLTKNWNIDIGRIGYSFAQNRITYPDLGFSRDLHCWNMGVSWQPQRGSYSFYLRVDPGTLDFIKVPYNKNQYDQTQGFF